MGIFDRKSDILRRLKVAAGLESLGIARQELDTLSEVDEQALTLAKKYGTYTAAVKAIEEEIEKEATKR